MSDVDGSPAADSGSRTGRPRAWTLLLVIAAALGIVLFAWLFWRSVTLEHLAADDARQPFDAALANFDSTTPLVALDASGRFVRRERSRSAAPPPDRFYVLAYRVADERLIRSDVPLWFLRVKGPAAQYMLRGTGLDLSALGLTAADLAAAGPGVVIDETAANGDRLLAWTR